MRFGLLRHPEGLKKRTSVGMPAVQDMSGDDDRRYHGRVFAMAYEVVGRDQPEQARSIVKELRDQFTEGLDTKDVRDADAFLAGKPLEKF